MNQEPGHDLQIQDPEQHTQGTQPAPGRPLVSRTRRRKPWRWEHEFLAVIARGGSATAACRAAGIDRTTARDAQARHPDFAAAWDEAHDAGVDLLEDAARERAELGVTKPIMYRGEVVTTVQEYSDRLTEFLLKAERPGKFREQVALTVAAAAVTPEELRALRGAAAEDPRVVEGARALALAARAAAKATRSSE